LVVLIGPANIGMPFEDEVGVGLGLEIGFEVGRQCLQGPLLTGYETSARPIRRRLSGWIINTVESESSLENLDGRTARRGWRIFDGYLGCGLVV